MKGLMNGKATMILPDGKIREGTFSNNIFYGPHSPVRSSSPTFDVG